ncbi:tape measure protein, partial [Delftia tsuruhatensis]|uniref:tape measure protein n=1 Tax=Delftia tsuruhatensis TaxID=180282 RepID=UPI002261042E
MSEELGAINFKADTTDLVRAEVALTKLADAGPKVERAIDGVEKAAAKTGRSLKSLGESSGRSLDDVGRSAPQAADGIGRVARSADDAKRSLAGMRDSAAGLSGVSSAAAQAAQGLRASATSVQEMQAAVRAATVTAQSLAAEMARVVPSVQAVIKAQADASKAALDMGLSFKTAGDQIKGFGVAAQQAAGQSREGADGVKSLADASGGLSANMGLAVRGIQAFLAMQVVNWAKDSAVALYDASAAAERLRIGLDFSSVRGSAAEIAYLRKTTFDLGLAFDSTAKAYQQFSAAARGTALEGEKSRAIFEAVAKASAVMGLSAENTSGVLLALQQMISKGTVQSEELRGQLGERLPGAFQTAARAMGVTTAELGKLLEQGKVVAEDFLPKFARELESSLGGAAEKAANRLDAAVNKFDNAWTRLKQNAGDSGVSNAMAAGLGTAAGSLDALSVSMERARSSGSGFWGQAASAIGTMYELGNSTDRAKINMYDNAKATAEAQKELDRLQKLAEIPGNGRWLLSEIGHINRYIASLQQAKRERDAAIGVDNFSATGGINIGSLPSRGSHANYERERAEAEKGVLAISARQNGVTKQFLSDLAAVEKAFATGVYGTGAEAAKTYASEVTKLNIARYESTKEGKEAAKAAKAGASAAHEEESTYARLVAAINAKIAANDAELFAGGRLSDSEKLRIQLQAQLEAGSKKMSAAHKAEALRLLEKLKSQEQEEKAIKRAITLNDQQLAMRQEQAEAEAEMQRRVDAVRMSLHSYTESVKDSVEMTELELRTMGMTNAERTVLIEQLRIEQDLRKRIREIENAPYQTQEARQADIDKATEAALQAKLNAQRRVFVSEWDKTSQMISDTLTDYIMRGGESAAEYLKRLFANLVLQPVVQAVVGGLIGGGGAGGAAASSLLGSGASGLVSNLIFGGMSLTTVGSSIGAGIMATLTGSSLGGAGAAGILAGGSSALGMFGGALPYLGAGLALFKILKGDWFGSRGPNHSGGVASTATTDRDLAVKQVLGTDAWGNTLGDFTTRKNEALDKQLQKTVNGMLEMYKALAKIGGGGAREIDIAAGFSTNPKYADEGVYGYFQILDKVTGEVLKKYKNRDMDRDPEKAWAQFVADMGGELVNEIKKGDIPGWMREELDALGEDVTVEGLNAAIQKIAVIDAAFKGWADTMTSFAGLTAKAQTELLKFSGGIEALAGNVNAFYAGFYSEQERAEILQRQVRDQLKKLGVVDIDPAGGEEAKKKFRALIEQALASGNTELAAKLLALAQLFGIAADSAQKSAEAAADAAKTAA